MPKSIRNSLIFLLLFSILISSQVMSDRAKADQKPTEPLVLNQEIVKALDFGLHNAAADLYWISTIQYYGGDNSDHYAKLYKYLSVATSLDPKFSYPYAFGILTLPGFNQTDDAIALGKIGIAKAQPDWRIPFYLATTYFLEKNDRENAVKYFDIAAETKNAPDNIRRISANFGARSDSREQTKEIWTGIYENSKDEVIKKRAENYIYHYELMTFLENAAKKYKEATSVYPKTAVDLVPSILKNVPEDPFGFTYKFDEAGSAIIE